MNRYVALLIFITLIVLILRWMLGRNAGGTN